MLQPAEKEKVLGINPLASVVEAEIKKNGPMPFSRYMQIWLNGAYGKTGEFFPGYYNGKNVVIGDNDAKALWENSDFFTPPEITPLLGITVAKQIIDVWESMGKPHDFRIVEMGAGTGALAHDILFGLDYFQKKDPTLGSLDAIKYIIIEMSPTLLEKQRKRQSLRSPRVEFINASAFSLPLRDITGVFISCELPDAFPVDIVVKTDSGEWKELFVDIGNQDRFKQIFRRPSEEVKNFLHSFQPEIMPYESYPVNIQAARWIKEMSRSLKKGYVITIDYDCWSRDGNICISSAKNKATRGGKEDPFAFYYKQNIGQCDLTSGVDFQTLVDGGKRNGFMAEGYVTLPGFLFGLRFDALSREIYTETGNIIGERRKDRIMSNAIYYEDEGAHWKVLIQSKGIENGQKPLAGVQFTFNDGQYGGTSDEAREKFRPVKL